MYISRSYSLLTDLFHNQGCCYTVLELVGLVELYSIVYEWGKNHEKESINKRQGNRNKKAQLFCSTSWPATTNTEIFITFQTHVLQALLKLNNKEILLADVGKIINTFFVLCSGGFFPSQGFKWAHTFWDFWINTNTPLIYTHPSWENTVILFWSSIGPWSWSTNHSQNKCLPTYLIDAHLLDNHPRYQ